MIALQSVPAEVRFTVSVTRAESGRVDTYDMVGHIELPPRTESPEIPDVTDPQHPGP